MSELLSPSPLKIGSVALGEGPLKIIVSLTGRTLAELKAQVLQLTAQAEHFHLLEWRIDHLWEAFSEATTQDAQLVSQAASPSASQPVSEPASRPPLSQTLSQQALSQQALSQPAPRSVHQSVHGSNHRASHGANPRAGHRPLHGSCQLAHIEQVAQELVDFLQLHLPNHPLIATFRTRAEGGQQDLHLDEYAQLLRHLAKSKLFAALDVEVFKGAAAFTGPTNPAAHAGDPAQRPISAPPSVLTSEPCSPPTAPSLISADTATPAQISEPEQLAENLDPNQWLSPEIQQLLPELSEQTTLIGSHHNFSQMPTYAELVGRLSLLAQCPIHLPKLAARATHPADLLTLWQAADQVYQRYQLPMILIAMGQFGTLSRLSGQAYGNAATFGRFGTGSAPGQIELPTLAQITQALAQL